MRIDRLVNMAMSQPLIKQLALLPRDGGLDWSESNIRKLLDAEASSAIQEVILMHPWDFAMTTTDNVVSTAGTSDYELAGSSNNCLDVYTLTYAGSRLIKKTVSALADLVGRRTIVATSYWTPWARKSGLMTVRITGTPTDSGKTFEYRYWRNDVNLGECPVGLDYLLQVTLAKRLAPSYQQAVDTALVNAIEAYERPGIDPDNTVLDVAVTSANNRRAQMHGWGG